TMEARSLSAASPLRFLKNACFPVRRRRKGDSRSVGRPDWAPVPRRIEAEARGCAAFDLVHPDHAVCGGVEPFDGDATVVRRQSNVNVFPGIAHTAQTPAVSIEPPQLGDLLR